MSDWDRTQHPRWHAGQSITSPECTDPACDLLHWTLHAEAPLKLVTCPTTTEALQAASKEMRQR